MAAIDPVKLYNVPYEAMEPTIRRNTDVQGDRSYYFKNEPKRWDVVVFLAPEVSRLGSELGKKKVHGLGKCIALINIAEELYREKDDIYRPQIYYVKRIIGLPGEAIHFGKDGVTINGSPLQIPSHLPHFSSIRKKKNDLHGFDEPFEIAPDSVFVIGDNVEMDVVDSRKCGPIPIGNLEARVVGVN